MPITQFPPGIELSILNGQTGFLIKGAAANDQSGSSVSSAGDVNGDGLEDLLIGAPYASPGGRRYAGASYVVFGMNGIGSAGSAGSLDLSTLNGINGFAINGIIGITELSTQYGDNSGASVSCAGDMNDDGISDLLIGAPNAVLNGKYYAGVTYVVFGQRGIGSSGSLELSTLNGINGFAIQGVAGGDNSGSSVSSAGDVNGDGLVDILIGAPYASPGGRRNAGISYVVFGKGGIGSGGFLDLSTLNGANGFALNGIGGISTTSSYGDMSGNSVSSAGDLNNDGITDLVIGAHQASPQGRQYAGSSYVVFGTRAMISAGTLELSALNGANGFVIIGGSAASYCGSFFGSGDVNGDQIADLLIGCNVRSYVVFGKNGIGSTGLLDLSTLNGANGFAFSGVVEYDVSGSIGDVNGDKIADILIGLNGGTITPNVVSGHVVFGRSGIGSSGLLDLSTLNGANGFGIIKSSADGGGSIFLTSVGDMNSDGIREILIGSPLASPGDRSNAGKSYVVLSDTGANLNTNRLTITKGQAEIISCANLNATAIKFLSRTSALIFMITNLQHGQFEQISNPGIAINSFTQQQVQSDQIQFVHDGSVRSPGYSVSVGDGGWAAIIPPQPANITWIHLGPKLVQNTLIINQGQTLLLTTRLLGAVDQDYPINNPNLIFKVSNVQHGRFELVINPGVAITTFTQAQIQTGNVQFVDDGSIDAPSYNAQVSDGIGGITSPIQAATVFFNRPPVLVNHSLYINQGQTLLLTSANLSATDPDDPIESLTFIVSTVQHGRFETISNLGTVVLSFTQGQVQNGDVVFIPDGSTNSPEFNVAVSDGKATTGMQTAIITFNLAPILVNNALNLQQGETVILSSNQLSATDPDESAESLIFIISNIQHGQFKQINSPSIALTNFTQEQVQNGAIEFVHDGSAKIPSYYVAVSDGKMIIAPKASAITFNAAPVLTSNQLTIIQGQTVTITPSDLSATDDHTAASDLVFTASNVIHGHFEDSSNPGNALIQFSQQRIFNGALKFVTDGSVLAPHYNISVSDGSLITLSSAAIINFSLNAAATTAADNAVRNAIIGAVISGVIGLGFFAIKAYLERKAAKSLQHAIEGEQSEIEKRLISFQREMIRPVAKKVFENIKTTNLIGYRSEKNTKAYVAAIETLLGKLVDEGVDLNLRTMQAAQQARLITEIAKQTRLHLVPEMNCCSTAYLCGFFKPAATPEQIEENAEAIAQAVASVLSTSRMPSASSLSHDIELPDISTEDSKNKTTLDARTRFFMLEKSMKDMEKRIAAIEQPSQQRLI